MGTGGIIVGLLLLKHKHLQSKLSRIRNIIALLAFFPRKVQWLDTILDIILLKVKWQLGVEGLSSSLKGITQHFLKIYLIPLSSDAEKVI